MLLSLTKVNRLRGSEFAREFGDVAEHSPWVAEAAQKARPFQSREAMIGAFERSIGRAPRERQLALLNAHPDLAGRAAMAGMLTQDSTREQAGAGLSALAPEEFSRLTRLNHAYKARFGFPFIHAVKGATKEQILAAFEARLGNAPDEEFEMALAQVSRIVRFRLEERVAA